VSGASSRGNPGPAAVAAVLLAPAGEELEARARPIGRATAAAAEYRANRLGLELATGRRPRVRALLW
jgi:ribonuclease HI